MEAKRLDAKDVGLPSFAGRFEAALDQGDAVEMFDLSSHRRARDALEFGLGVARQGFNIFVLGDERTGRVEATRDYLERHAPDLPVPSDWVYLNNFRRPDEPTPYALPAGQGRKFRDRMAEMVPALAAALRKSFEAEEYGNRLRTEREKVEKVVEEGFTRLRERARAFSLDVLRTPQGMALVVLGPDGKPRPPEDLATLSDDDKARLEKAHETIRDDMAAIESRARAAERQFMDGMREINRKVADQAIRGFMDELDHGFGEFEGLGGWLTALRADIIDNIHLFQPQPPPTAPPREPVETRYAVNLVVDNGDMDHAAIVTEANPTYENLFGSIEYRAVSGMLQTDFSMIRGGAMHRANGGILMLRAEAVAANPLSWHFLKSALRDRQIRIEEVHRFGGIPMAGTPKPGPIPLDLKVVLVGSPRWYYLFLSLDPDFTSLFRVKADIDGDMDADDANIATYARLIGQSARQNGGCACDRAAIAYLLGQSARWAGDRNKISARFEQIDDILREAGSLDSVTRNKAITAADVKKVLVNRRIRNSRIEDRGQEAIRLGTHMIDTTGSVVGQVNALTVADLGDHIFGAPSRVTARTHVGRLGVINIERAVAMGGPIQQKGVMIIEGFLNGLFANRFPLSFSCSITFEQAYGGVEGDSASQAELYAVLSALSGLAIRQDVAVTGSVNQVGQTQAIGGANHKVEGFFRCCLESGLTGRQGVMVPAANERHLALRDEVAEAVAAGRFHLWSVTTIAEGISLLTGVGVGAADAAGVFPPDSVFGRAMTRLEAFDRALTERALRRE